MFNRNETMDETAFWKLIDKTRMTSTLPDAQAITAWAMSLAQKAG
jgi:hypothetical protein